MELKGKVIQLLQPQTGTSAKGQWKKQEFILEIPGQYPKKVCCSLWGMDKVPPRLGELVSVSINLESREYNAKWFTEVRAWKIESTDPGAPQTTGDQTQSSSGFASAPAVDDGSDGLPF